MDSFHSCASKEINAQISFAFVLLGLSEGYNYANEVFYFQNPNNTKKTAIWHTTMCKSNMHMGQQN